MSELARKLLSPFDEDAFQRGIRETNWFKEFVRQYGEEPDLDTPSYDYRKAWANGIRPQRDRYDSNRYHWPSSLPDGGALKSGDHPTAWKEHFMRQWGVNPDALPLKQFRRDQLFPEEQKFFEKNPNVSGMATDDRRVILNPYSSPEINRDLVGINELARLYMRHGGNGPEFALTPEQEAILSGTSYINASPQDRRDTIAARLLSMDPSAGRPTDDQVAYVSTLARSLLRFGQ